MANVEGLLIDPFEASDSDGASVRWGGFRADDPSRRRSFDSSYSTAFPLSCAESLITIDCRWTWCGCGDRSDDAWRALLLSDGGELESGVGPSESSAFSSLNMFGLVVDNDSLGV